MHIFRTQIPEIPATRQIDHVSVESAEILQRNYSGVLCKR